jgi:formylglycine-generating enzyme required for sulfatase activity
MRVWVYLSVSAVVVALAATALFQGTGTPECPEGMTYIPDEGGFCIFKYEASRADANSTHHGVSDVAASQQGVIPWINVTWFEAKEACESAGYSLVTNEQWQAATGAEIGNESTFVHGNNHYGEDIETGKRCEDDPTQAGLENGRGRCLTGTGPSSWETDRGVEDLNGNVWEWTSTRYKNGSVCDLGRNGYVAGWNRTLECPTELGESQRFGNDHYWEPERPRSGYVLRGAAYQYRRQAGPFAMDLRDLPENSIPYLGFRCAYNP